MTWQTGSPQTTLRSCSSVAMCATTPSFRRSSTVFLPLSRALGSPDRSTTIRPGLLSVLGGTFQVGADDLVLPLLLLPVLPDVADDLVDLLDLLDFDEPSDDLELFSFGAFFLSPELVVMVLTDFLLASVPGAGAANKSRRLRTYALSALATGSPSLRKLRNKLFFRCGRHSTSSGLVNGIKLTGGVPNVMQWMRLKHAAIVVSSLTAAFDVASI